MVEKMAEKIQTVLAGIKVPGTDFSVGDISTISGDSVDLAAGYPIARCSDDIVTEVQKALKDNGIDIQVKVSASIPSVQPQNSAQRVEGVKNIVAVASGKGGVGKSTTSVNLALALAYEGARVGLLDADIYGPSLPQMLGLGSERPEVVGGNAIKPLMAHGIQVVSMGSLVTENTPMIWRGPMVSGALKQLLNQTLWDDVDYLIIDMPPGTGDIQLTLSQSVPVSSSVVVTTPQDIALLDAKKGIEMFRKVNIPVAGVVENMSMHICSNCGHHEAIFGENGGEQLAREFGTQLLGQLPLQKTIREQVDSGCPPVASDPESEVSQAYRNIAAKIASDLWVRSTKSDGPEISFVDD
ncbi:MAG: iron-sulfur cluster carrier protein ApbC [Agarilytica sp.]